MITVEFKPSPSKNAVPFAGSGGTLKVELKGIDGFDSSNKGIIRDVKSDDPDPKV